MDLIDHLQAILISLEPCNTSLEGLYSKCWFPPIPIYFDGNRAISGWQDEAQYSSIHNNIPSSFLEHYSLSHEYTSKANELCITMVGCDMLECSCEICVMNLAKKGVI
jgi:hypothetical protein